jgi:hypothetical protein
MTTIFRNGQPIVGVGLNFQAGWRPAPPRVGVVRRPSPPAIHAHETAALRAWRPEWGNRPVGFGAVRWRPEWGARPVWFGARQWRYEWGAQPPWWNVHINVQQDDPQLSVPDDAPPDPSTNGAAPTPSPAASPTSSGAVPASAPSTAAATAPDAGAGPAAVDTTKPGLSTLAKIGIAGGAVVVVGGTIAAIIAASSKK